MSPEDRTSLRRTAVEVDTSVADLVRGLARGLAEGVVGAEELLTRMRRETQVMEKIPTIFERDERFAVTAGPRPGCEWVFAGEGKATEKLDGTNIRLTVRTRTVVRVEKRRNPSTVQKHQGIVDGWYVDADPHGAEDKWVFEAVAGTSTDGWPDGEHPGEALGPRIQGNPLALDRHLVVPFNLEIPAYEDVPRSFDGLLRLLARLDSKFAPGHTAEGIVFHHPDGRRAKIKRKDFPRDLLDSVIAA